MAWVFATIARAFEHAHSATPSLHTHKISHEAVPGSEQRGIRSNVQFAAIRTSVMYSSNATDSLIDSVRQNRLER